MRERRSHLCVRDANNNEQIIERNEQRNPVADFARLAPMPDTTRHTTDDTRA
jgi:hypothetical protein